MSLTRTALHAYKWSVLGDVVSGASGPLIVLVLARVLVPEDFGVVAAATVVISLSQLISDLGLKRAVIQRQDRVDEAASIAFWVNVVVAVLIALLILWIAPAVAGYFHDPRIATVVRVLSLQLVLASLGAIHITLLQRQMEFRAWFWVRLFTSVAPILASVPLALAGMGYWALVAGTLSGQAVQTSVLWLRSSWRPRWVTDRRLARELVGFGLWATLSSILGWFYAWMDAMIVGHYLGARDLGLYRTGNTLVIMIFGVFFSPLLPVLYTLFSRSQQDLARLKEALRMVARGIALIALPIAAFLYVFAEPVGTALFGSRWQGVDRVIAVMALVHGVSWIAGANGEAYRAIGKPHVETWTSALMLSFYLGGYLYAIRFGLERFLHARLALALIAFVVHIAVARLVLSLPFRAWVHGGIVVTASGAALVVYHTGALLPESHLTVGLLAILFLVLSAVGLAVFERTFVMRLIQMARPGIGT